jgi:tetratricopeptide (TPR) repeat protein
MSSIACRQRRSLARLRNVWRSTFAAAVLAAIAGSTGLAQERAQRGAEDPANACGIVYGNVYGPYDYLTQRDKLKIVEDFHFTPQVEALRSGQSASIGGDLDYTLHSSPNHHRALAALMRYSERQKAMKLEGMKFPVECYFDRAIRFRPDDTKVRVLYAQYLHKNRRTGEGLRQLEMALDRAGDDGAAHYNIGIVYFQMADYERALQQAHRALALGLREPQLERLLKREGKWRDPEKGDLPP